MLIKVDGNLPRKSNSRQLVMRYGHPTSIKSARALSYERLFFYQVLKQRPSEPITGDCSLTAEIYYNNKLCDLSDELLADLLEKCGFVANDRQFKVKNLYWHFDKEHPRLIAKIEQLTGPVPTPLTTPPATGA